MANVKDDKKQIAFLVKQEFYQEIMRFAEKEDLAIATYVRLALQEKIRKEREREREENKM